MAATVLNCVLAERARSDGAKRAHEKRKKEGHDVASNIRDTKRLTTGVLTANGIHSLHDPQFLKSFDAQELAGHKKQEKAASTKLAKKNKNISVVRMTRSKHGHEQTHQFFNCSAEECATYLQYKKQDKDPQMLKSLGERRL